jgi:hypothetical protein
VYDFVLILLVSCIECRSIVIRNGVYLRVCRARGREILRCVLMGEWMGVGVQPAEIFDKCDLEKGDAEFARNLYMLDLRKKPADVCPKPSKKCKQFLTNNESKVTDNNHVNNLSAGYFVVTLIVCTTIAAIVLLVMYIPKSSGDGCGLLESTDNRPDAIRRRCLTSAGTNSSSLELQESAHTQNNAASDNNETELDRWANVPL